MPSIQRLTINGGDGKRRYLSFCEPELLSIMNIAQEQGINLVCVDSAGNVSAWVTRDEGEALRTIFEEKVSTERLARQHTPPLQPKQLAPHRR